MPTIAYGEILAEPMAILDRLRDIIAALQVQRIPLDERTGNALATLVNQMQEKLAEDEE